MHEIQQLARPARPLTKAALTVLLVVVDPIALVPRMGMGCLAGNAEAFSKLGDRVAVQSIIFEETLSLFAHGNTSPAHRALPPCGGECYPCPENMCYLCPGTVHPPQ